MKTIGCKIGNVSGGVRRHEMVSYVLGDVRNVNLGWIVAVEHGRRGHVLSVSVEDDLVAVAEERRTVFATETVPGMPPTEVKRQRGPRVIRERVLLLATPRADNSLAGHQLVKVLVDEVGTAGEQQRAAIVGGQLPRAALLAGTRLRQLARGEAPRWWRLVC